MNVIELKEISKKAGMELHEAGEYLSFINGYFLIDQKEEYKSYVKKICLKNHVSSDCISTRKTESFKNTNQNLIMATLWVEIGTDGEVFMGKENIVRLLKSMSEMNIITQSELNDKKILEVI